MTAARSCAETRDTSVAGPPVEDTSECLNCGTPGNGHFCTVCGQVRVPTLPGFREWLGETIDALFNVDGRTARTLRELFTRPGQLSLDFIEGRRARYVPPLRLYLIASIIYFFASSFTETTRFMFVSFAGDGFSSELLAQTFPRVMFLVVPLVALISKGLHHKQRRPYAGHLVFVLHLFSFWFLTFALDLFANPFVGSFFRHGNWWAAPAALASVLISIGNQVYLYMTLRRLNGDGILKTIGKQILFLLGFALTLGAGTAGILWVQHALQ
ncbi:MAG: DUF3667 domain-containing protein [Myxococcota bacterium]